MQTFELFNIPKKAIVNQTISIKKICEQCDLSVTDKTILNRTVKSVTLIAEINENTTGLWPVKNENESFETIYIFNIVLKKNDSVKEICKIVHSIFPNHCLLQLEYQNRILISSAIKRINKVDRTKTVIESISLTNWFSLDQLHMELCNKFYDNISDLKKIYININNIINIEPYVNQFKKVPNSITDDTIQKSNKIRELTNEIEKLNMELKQSNSIKGKMEHHVQIKQLEKQIKNIKI